MESEIKNVKILGEKVIVKYIQNDIEKEFEILLKTYIEFPFSVGQIIDEKKYKEIIKIDEKNAIINEAYNHLKRSDLTSDELSKKLLKKHPNKRVVINKIINDLKDKNLINDEQFVLHFIKKGINSFKGLDRIIYELQYKGIDEQIIYQNINDDIKEMEKEKAYQLGSKQMRLSKNLEFKKMRDKVYYKLSYAGYNKEIIEEIMYKLNLIKEI